MKAAFGASDHSAGSRETRPNANRWLNRCARRVGLYCEVWAYRHYFADLSRGLSISSADGSAIRRFAGRTACGCADSYRRNRCWDIASLFSAFALRPVPGDGTIIFSDLKLEVLRVRCDKCGRDGSDVYGRLLQRL